MLYIGCEKCYQAFCSEKCSSEVHLFELSLPLNLRRRGVPEVLTSVGWIFAFDNTRQFQVLEHTSESMNQLMILDI